MEGPERHDVKRIGETKDKRKSGNGGPEFQSGWMHFDRMLLIKDCIQYRKCVRVYRHRSYGSVEIGTRFP